MPAGTPVVAALGKEATAGTGPAEALVEAGWDEVVLVVLAITGLEDVGAAAAVELAGADDRVLALGLTDDLRAVGRQWWSLQ